LANGSERRMSERLFRERWFHVAAYVALVFAVSAQPHLHVPGTWEYRDKVVHILEYGVLGWLVYRAAVGSWPAAGFARRALLTIVAVSAVGACDEKFQEGVPGRDSSVYDWIADTAGATLAQVVCLGLEKRRGVA
jgi:VanZ family protein